MKIRPSTRLMAIHDVFRRLKLDSRHRFVESDLLRDWNRTGLRYSDLQIVVRDLILRGRLELQTVGETTHLQIKDSSLIKSDSASTDLLTRTLDWLALRHVRNRQRGMTRPAKRRQRSHDRR